MNAETKPSLITLSQKHNRKKSSAATLAFLLCNWSGRHGMDRRRVSRAGRPTALQIKGQAQNSSFQTGVQGIINQSPSLQDECKYDWEGPDAAPGTNAAPQQPGVHSEPWAGLGLLCVPVPWSWSSTRHNSSPAVLWGSCNPRLFPSCAHHSHVHRSLEAPSAARSALCAQPGFPIPAWRQVEIHVEIHYCHPWGCQGLWPLPSVIFTC